MAGSKSAYLEAIVQDFLLSGVAYTVPSTLYVALSTSAFSVTATGSACDEVSGGSYARVSVTNNATSFPASTGSNPATKSLAVDVIFPTATASWGTILSAYLCDASTAGNILIGADLLTATAVPSGTTYEIPASSWTFLEY